MSAPLTSAPTKLRKIKKKTPMDVKPAVQSTPPEENNQNKDIQKLQNPQNNTQSSSVNPNPTAVTDVSSLPMRKMIKKKKNKSNN